MTSEGRMWRRKTDRWPNCRMVIESQCPEKDPLNVNRMHSRHLEPDRDMNFWGFNFLGLILIFFSLYCCCI